jgi:Cytochrome c554 and c-prime
VPWASGLFFSLVVCAALAAQQSDSIGAAACGSCHREQFETQSRSGHARSLSPPGEHALAARFDGLSAALGDGFQYRFERRGQALWFHVQKDDAAREQRVDWAFGAGVQAITFVSRLDEDAYVELRASYYPAAGAAITPGHQNQKPATPGDALGVRYKTFSPRSQILSCFGCHSTGMPSLEENFALHPAELGVRCESCHGAGRQHADLIAAGRLADARRAIGNPARLTPPELMNFCGECHRPPAKQGVAIDWSDPWNVRHQPVYLSQSACFRQSAGGLTCMRCHDPHQPLRRNDVEYYNARCASCHNADTHPPAAVCRAASGCVSCHMPAVRPQPELAFHNHWIGVYQPGDALRPQR